jgi:tRNA G46 methylase TrmB
LDRRKGKRFNRLRRALEGQAELLELLARYDNQFLLDTGCGTGESTISLARENSELLVLGVDRSEDRLRKASARFSGAGVDNAFFLRFDVGDLWIWLEEQGLRPLRQYFLYPNPYPKKQHLSRRWHAHPGFPIALSFGGELHLRTNWRIYAEEFACAVHHLTGCSVEVMRIETDEEGWEAMTAFEKKYAESGHELWEVSTGQTSCA